MIRDENAFRVRPFNVVSGRSHGAFGLDALGDRFLLTILGVRMLLLEIVNRLV